MQKMQEATATSRAEGDYPKTERRSWRRFRPHGSVVAANWIVKFTGAPAGWSGAQEASFWMLGKLRRENTPG